MKQFKQAIILAAELHETSFILKGDYAGAYTKTIRQATDEACKQLNFNETTPVFLLLSCSWNDALNWAETKL